MWITIATAYLSTDVVEGKRFPLFVLSVQQPRKGRTEMRWPQPFSTNPRCKLDVTHSLPVPLRSVRGSHDGSSVVWQPEWQVSPLVDRSADFISFHIDGLWFLGSGGDNWCIYSQPDGILWDENECLSFFLLNDDSICIPDPVIRYGRQHRRPIFFLVVSLHVKRVDLYGGEASLWLHSQVLSQENNSAGSLKGDSTLHQPNTPHLEEK